MGRKGANEEVKKKPQTAEETRKKDKATAEEQESKESAAKDQKRQEEAKDDKDREEKEQAETTEAGTGDNEEAVETEETDSDTVGAEEKASDEDNTAGEKKKLFPKREKKDRKDEKIEELTDRVARQMAEFENFRKRTEKEKSQMFETGAKSIIEKILPVIDNFERGLAAVPENEKDSPFVDGMDKIYKQMLKELENAGVTPIEAVGQEFDPELHNAVMQVESEEYESGIVAQELQKGYKYRDTVVRHSMVAVVQ